MRSCLRDDLPQPTDPEHWILGVPKRCVRTLSRSCVVSCKSLIILWGSCGALVRMPTRSHLASPESDSSGWICIPCRGRTLAASPLQAARAGTASSPGWRLAISGRHHWQVFQCLLNQLFQQMLDRTDTLSRTVTAPRLTYCAAVVASNMAILGDVVDRRSAAKYTGFSHGNKSLTSHTTITVVRRVHTYAV